MPGRPSTARKSGVTRLARRMHNAAAEDTTTEARDGDRHEGAGDEGSLAPEGRERSALPLSQAVSRGKSQGRELLHHRAQAQDRRRRPRQLQLSDQEFRRDQLVPGQLHWLSRPEARPAVLRIRRRALRPREKHGCHLHSHARRPVGVTIPAWNDGSTFSITWGTLIAQKGWEDVPDEYKGRGAAGAMAWKGLATLVDMQGIWRGDLEPGAVIQVWGSEADFENAKAGKSAFGHSFIFLNYIYSGSA